MYSRMHWRKLENPEKPLQTPGEPPPHRKAALTVLTTATPWCQNNENHLTLSVFEERLISTDWTCYWSCLDSPSLPAVPHSWDQSQSTLFWCVELLQVQLIQNLLWHLQHVGQSWAVDLREFLLWSVLWLQELLHLLMNWVVVHLSQTVEDVDASVRRNVFTLHLLQVVDDSLDDLWIALCRTQQAS